MCCERDLLGHGVTGLQRVRERQRERPAVDLVGGVGPIALVLHLEDVAGELELRRDALVAEVERPDVEQRLPRRDQVREAEVPPLAVRGQRPRILPGEGAGQHRGQPHAVGPQRRQGPDREPQVQVVLRDSQLVGPVGLEVAVLVADAQRAVQCVRAGLPAVLDDLRRNGVPVAVPQRRPQTLEERGPVEGDSAELIALGAQRPAPELSRSAGVDGGGGRRRGIGIGRTGGHQGPSWRDLVGPP